MREVLLFDAVSKGFDRGRDHVPVLEDISLSVNEGEIVAVVGGGGQGKTTLMRLASGTLPADRGRICVTGIDMSPLKDRQRQRLLASEVGIVTGTGPALPVCVREFVEMKAAAPRTGWRRRHSRRDRRSMTTAILDELGITECADMRWQDLSDWERVIAELAQALVVRPRVLLVDAVTDNFGLRQKEAAMALLEDAARQHGCGVFMAASDHESVLRSVRVWQLHRRRLELWANHDVAETLDADVIPLPKRRDAQ
ncbi:MAG TPA: ATP-binding cassette domain-containing protein [Solirubrobacteraceae bacterium]|nr:ATP-binding cassette domain-containing protein [Solirubrobacteraceae bacterium]